MIPIIICVILLCILLFVLAIYNNKFQLAVIKIDKAEEDINIYLQRKIELLDRTRPIIKKELKLKQFMTELDDVENSASNFTKNDLLKNIYNNLFKILDEHEKLYKSESLRSVLDLLNDNEENIVGAIKFYNDTVVDYNQLVMTFPTKLIAIFKGYKKKEFYNNEKREFFEILNN